MACCPITASKEHLAAKKTAQDNSAGKESAEDVFYIVNHYKTVIIWRRDSISVCLRGTTSEWLHNWCTAGKER